jgi:hypothetical protein
MGSLRTLGSLRTWVLSAHSDRCILSDAASFAIEGKEKGTASFAIEGEKKGTMRCGLTYH